jgi:hypothetical protein
LIRSQEFENYAKNNNLIVTKKGLVNILNQFISGKANILELSKFSDFVLRFRANFLKYEHIDDEDDTVADAITTFDFTKDKDENGNLIDGEFTIERAKDLIKKLGLVVRE